MATPVLTGSQFWAAEAAAGRLEGTVKLTGFDELMRELTNCL